MSNRYSVVNLTLKHQNTIDKLQINSNALKLQPSKLVSMALLLDITAGEWAMICFYELLTWVLLGFGIY